MDKHCLIVHTNNNTYLVSRKRGIVIYIHPIMDKLINMSMSGINIDNDANILRLGGYTPEQIIYYRNKLNYYINSGFFVSDFANFSLKELKVEDIDFFFSHSPQIVFELTEVCNMRCEYCVYGEHYITKNRNKSILDEITIKRFLTLFIEKTDKRLRNYKKLRVDFYGGEPLLRFDTIRSVVEYSFKKDYTDIIEWGMTTNATLLNQEIIDFLIKYKFKIVISLDGDIYNNSYRKLKNGQSSFEKVIENINLIRQTSLEYLKKNVRFNSVLHNKNSVTEIYNFFQKNYQKTPNISELTTINSDDNPILSYMRRSSEHDHNKNLKKEFDTSPQKRALLAFLKMYSTNYYDSFNDLLYYRNKDIPCIYPSGTCLPFTKKIFITAKGKIKPCEKLPIDFDLGEVYPNGDIAIDYPTITNFYNSIYKNIWKQCTKCFGKHNCGVCFFYLKDILQTNKDIKCNNFKTFKGEKELISFYLSIIENNYTFYINCINTVWE